MSGRVFASSDWHGNWELAQKVLNFLGPDDKLYYLGDCIDRGDNGIKILDALLIDPRVTFVKGNHEELMQFYIPELLDKGDVNQEWLQNGGAVTADYLLKNKTKKEITNYIRKLASLPLETHYNSPNGHIVFLEHAGYTPLAPHYYHHDPLWDREHFIQDWAASENVYMIHGHTPVPYLKWYFSYKGKKVYFSDDPNFDEEDYNYGKEWLRGKHPEYKPNILRYCDGHKFDVDVATIDSQRVALLDLDTFEEIYFDAETQSNAS